eukprot:1256154-Prymnesium_polylepis.1
MSFLDLRSIDGEIKLLMVPFREANSAAPQLGRVRSLGVHWVADALKSARGGPTAAAAQTDGAPPPVTGDGAAATALRDAMSTGEVALIISDLKSLLGAATPSGVKISQCLARATVIGLKRFDLSSPSPVE